MVTETKRGCVRCGGNALHDYLPECDHVEWWELVPEPALVYAAPGQEIELVCEAGTKLVYNPRREGEWWAWAEAPDLGGETGLLTTGPTPEIAERKFREGYAIGMFVDALFRKLTGWAKEGEQLRKLDEAIDRAALGPLNGSAPVTIEGFYESQAELEAEISRACLPAYLWPTKDKERLRSQCRGSKALAIWVDDVPTEPRPLRVGDRVRSVNGGMGTIAWVGRSTASVRVDDDLVMSGVRLDHLTRIDDEEPRGANVTFNINGPILSASNQAGRKALGVEVGPRVREAKRVRGEK